MLQNDDANYGVGILYENGLTTFLGWQKRLLLSQTNRHSSR